MKLSFSLNAKKPATGTAPPRKPPTAFGGFNDGADEGDGDPDAGVANVAKKARGDVNRLLAAQSASAKLTKAEKKKIAAELKVDNTVFQYDEVYDAMKDSEARAKARKEDEEKERKPKYISGLLATAETRRLDRLRADEKLYQREREQEGEEFAGKPSYVTDGYLAQVQETRAAEEAEKAREGMSALKSKGPTSSGMAHFYKTLLDQNEAVHSAAVAATSTTTSAPEAEPEASTSNAPGRLTAPGGPSLTIAKPTTIGPARGPLSDVELAALARAEGKDVELNDDNQIVDKRDLLNAGLNLSLPNTRHLELSRSTKKTASEEPVVTHRAVGTAASRKQIDERRRREVEQQWQEERERMLAEKRKREEEERERMIRRRNDDEAIQSARERYLARKKRKLEDGSAADAGEAPPEATL
ncbi:hypothetical protein AURDEDRAFT_142078 [Auricularia subglabra TFB-10046 SS5]|nr:hypothetical protein AURDEDRAFT_142078 [Auricularia subglabra TFB-10046 SS5]